MLVLQLAHDIIHVKLENLPSMGSSNTPQLTTAIVGLLSAIIGGVITIWYKRKELKNISGNLLLQKQLFDETKTNNENKIKAEIIRLQDFRKEYELKLKQFDYSQFEKVLEFSQKADDKTISDKIEAVKFYNNFLLELNKNVPPNSFFFDYSEYEEFVVDRFNSVAPKISEFIEEYNKKFPHVFLKAKSKIIKLKMMIDNLRHDIDFLESESDDPDNVIYQFTEDILKAWEELHNILNDLTAEFSELEDLRKNFIKEKYLK